MSRRTPDQCYRRIRLTYIEGARKRPAEFEKRLNHFLRMTEKKKQFGFGGIDSLLTAIEG